MYPTISSEEFREGKKTTHPFWYRSISNDGYERHWVATACGEAIRYTIFTLDSKYYIYKDPNDGGPITTNTATPFSGPYTTLSAAMAAYLLL